MSPISALSSRLAAHALDRVRAWSVESQLGARRNAMVATTALAARRAEREDVEAYLDTLTPRDRVLRVSVATSH